MWKKWTAVAENVYIAETPSFVTDKKEKISLDYGGIPGDLHFGLTKKAGAREPMYQKGTEIFNRRQISIVSVEECLVMAEKLGVPAVLPEWLGANIALSGLPHLTSLREGSRLIFPSGAALLCEGENEPCSARGSHSATVSGQAEACFPICASCDGQKRNRLRCRTPGPYFSR